MLRTFTLITCLERIALKHIMHNVVHCCPPKIFCQTFTIFSSQFFISQYSFDRFSSAALAFENCDGKYRAVFAGKVVSMNMGRSNVIIYFLFSTEPKPSRSSSSDGSGGSNNYADERHSNPLSVLPGVGLSPEFAGDNDCVLHVICSPMVNFIYANRTFDVGYYKFKFQFR